MSSCKTCSTARSRPGRLKYKAARRKPREIGPQPCLRDRRRAAHKRYWAKRRAVFLAAHSAHMAVQRALRDGILVRPAACSNCGNPCKPDGHHHRGYEKASWLDVVWLCRPCHREHDRRKAVTA